jgi:hypothetical protein
MGRRNRERYSGNSTLHVRVEAFCHASLVTDEEKRSLLCCSNAWIAF